MRNLLDYRQLMVGLLVFAAIAIAWAADSAVRTVDTGVALGITVLLLGDMVIEKRRNN
jgi:hypothetical protein